MIQIHIASNPYICKSVEFKTDNGSWRIQNALPETNKPAHVGLVFELSDIASLSIAHFLKRSPAQKVTFGAYTLIGTYAYTQSNHSERILFFKTEKILEKPKANL